MFNLEKLEKRILIFLLGMLLFGTGVVVYKKSCPAGSLHLERPYYNGSPATIENISKKININKASPEELAGLNGVGPVLAGRIAEYRLKKGLFISAEDLKKVPGVGDKLFLKIKDSISLE